LSGLLCLFINLDILDVAASKDNVFEFLLGRRNVVCDLTIFSSKGKDILEGNGRLFRIDFVQRSNISKTDQSFVV